MTYPPPHLSAAVAEDIPPYSRPNFPSLQGQREGGPSSSGSMSSRSSGGRRRAEGGPGSRRNPSDAGLPSLGPFQPEEEELEVNYKSTPKLQ